MSRVLLQCELEAYELVLGNIKERLNRGGLCPSSEVERAHYLKEINRIIKRLDESKQARIDRLGLRVLS